MVRIALRMSLVSKSQVSITCGGVVRIWRVERRPTLWPAHFHLTVGNDLTTDLYFSLMMSRRPRFRYRISNLARPGIPTTT